MLDKVSLKNSDIIFCIDVFTYSFKVVTLQTEMACSDHHRIFIYNTKKFGAQTC